MNVELTIKGEVDVLRLQPGDTLVVTLAPGHFRHRDLIMEQIEAFFPEHKVALLAEGISLSVQREEAA